MSPNYKVINHRYWDSKDMNNLDFESARENMVEQQIRPWDVLEPRVLDVIRSIPRENFMPEEYRNIAYADTAIPTGSFDGEECCMLHPIVEGRILQHLDITKDCTVLEIGTGTGYLTACMAKLSDHVDSVDIHEELTEIAANNLADQGITNINLSTGDASKSWDQKPAYDAIAITGSMSQVPEAYKKLLKVGGRLFVIIGEAPTMKALLITRTSKTEWNTEELFETIVTPIINCEAEEPFIF